MKYIRTKSGQLFTVVEKIDKTKFNRSFKYLYRIKEVEKIVNGSDVIVDVNVVKEADTIEELCDEFVYLFEGRHFYCRWNKLIKKWQTLPDFFEMSDDKIKTIKGAIWTDKGLIYVAKMNDKGELELC